MEADIEPALRLGQRMAAQRVAAGGVQVGDRLLLRAVGGMVGGELAVGPGPKGGVQVRCRFPKA